MFVLQQFTCIRWLIHTLINTCFDSKELELKISVDWQPRQNDSCEILFEHFQRSTQYLDIYSCWQFQNVWAAKKIKQRQFQYVSLNISFRSLPIFALHRNPWVTENNRVFDFLVENQNRSDSLKKKNADKLGTWHICIGLVKRRSEIVMVVMINR